MFDIGVPELATIAIVALVVLGPERLPEVMKQAGKWYRQAMNFRAELMSQVADAQRAFREEMDAVERAANVKLDEVAPDPALPPPLLRQVPTYRKQPDKAQEAGPFGLPAWYRDMSPEVDMPALASLASSPFVLRRTVGDTLLGNSYVTSTRTLIAPIHPFDDPRDPIAVEARRKRDEGSRRKATFDMGRVGLGPSTDTGAGTKLLVTESASTAREVIDERTAREGAVVTLFEAGIHTKETAASALEIPVAEFERLLVARNVSSAVTMV